MQFLPVTWKKWGVDATGSGSRIRITRLTRSSAAARYLHAAGAQKNIAQRVFAYNHARLVRAVRAAEREADRGDPDQLIGALNGLVQGHFPVAAQATYADDSVELADPAGQGLRTRRSRSTHSGAEATNIFAKQGAPVIAVNDGKIVKVGHSPAAWVTSCSCRTQTGNVYTYAHLGWIPKLYPVPKPVRITAKQI